jgi:hypothetical protein
MVTVVVVINLAIALILLYLAWQLRQIRQRLARLAITLIAIERSTHAVLWGAPNTIFVSQAGINQLRQGNEPLQLQLQQVRQVLSLLVVGRQAWQRFRPAKLLRSRL